jgi:ABC-type protease/lipase transport system fused ATPase/permease subunit
MSLVGKKPMFSELTRRLASKPTVSAMAAALSVLIALLGLAPAIFASQVMGRFASHGRVATLVTMSIGLVIALAGEMTIRLLRHRLLESVCVPADEDLTKQLFARIAQAERPRVLGALETISGTYSAFRAATVMDVPAGFLYLAALWCVSTQVGLAATFCVLLALTLELGMGRVAAVSTAAREGIRGRILNLPAGTDSEAAITDWMDSGVHVTRGTALREGVMIMSNNSAYCFVIAVGALMVVDSNLPASALFGAGLLTSRAVSILTKIGSLRSELKRALPTMEGIVRLLRERSPQTAGAIAAAPAPAALGTQHAPIPSISAVAGRRA